MQKEVDKRSFIEKYFLTFVRSLAIIIIVYVLLIDFTPLGDWAINNSRCYDKKTIMNEKWSGTVYMKKRIKEDHNVKGLFISNYIGYLNLIGINDKLYDITNIGDSIVKDKGSLKVKIYRNDTILKYYYSINCKE